MCLDGKSEKVCIMLQMGDGNMSTLVAALKLDEHPLTNQFLYVEELNNADGSFILSTITKQQIERRHKIILVLCHNSFGHFHSISQKLGYNLMSLKDSGEVYVIDVLENITSKDFLMSSEPLKQIYVEIKQQLDVWGSEQNVCIIVENLGNLLLADVKDCLAFVSYLRAIALEHETSSLVLSMHTFSNCTNFSYITKSIRHVADVIVFLKDLQTGRANDVTGHLTVIRHDKMYAKTTSQYQYQLQDKSISVFTPGSRGFL